MSDLKIGVIGSGGRGGLAAHGHKPGEGSRIVAFEVEEQWVRAARSAAVPEGGTKAMGGKQPRLVDVRFADDQMEIPPKLIPDLQEFIVPGSGRVIEVK